MKKRSIVTLRFFILFSLFPKRPKKDTIDYRRGYITLLKRKPISLEEAFEWNIQY